MTTPETPQVPQQAAPVSPPTGYAPYPPPYAPRPPKRPNYWGTPGGIFLIIFGVLALVAALGASLQVVGKADAADMDVDITSCEFSGGMLPAATVGYTVTNNGSRTRSARIAFEYRDSGGARIDTDTARVRDIAPGDTVRGEETTILDAEVSSGRCAIVGVS